LTEPLGLGQPLAERYPHLTGRLFVNGPFNRLRQGLLGRFIHHGIRPEIGLEGNCLHDRSLAEFQEVATALRKGGLACTLHAPFGDLAPGASDPGVRGASRRKLGKALALIEIFAPVAIVCHLGYEDNKHAWKKSDWLTHSLETWQELLQLAVPAGVPLMLENTYERSPEIHREILGRLNSPQARFCLDVGHTLAFAGNSWRDWLPELSPWLGHLHLHDNRGGRDEHLAVGQGIFDFAGLFAYLRQAGLRPSITLEPHREGDLVTSLEALDQLELPEAPNR
jgi:sugar phosphate isomerase/epimerase